MSEDALEIVQTLMDDTGERVVEIARHPEGHFTYAELHRDGDGWNAVDGDVPIFKSEFAAYAAATRDVAWLID